VQRLSRDFGRDARLVRNGVNTSRFRPPLNAAERARDRADAGLDRQLVILAIGGIEPRKGSLTLLDAFARLSELVPELDPLLVIAGGATLFDYRDEVSRFDARVGQLGLGDRVRVLGSLPCDQLERLYRAADIFAFPSTTEGFGLAALEALASGLPVVASDLDALQTFLEDGRSAVLVPVGDSGALAGELATLARDPLRRRRLLAGGLELAAGFSWDAAAVAHERAYAELLPRLGAHRGDRGDRAVAPTPVD
jgi:glycosyltransferase involved in cell wall biosynthesis